ncbi:MAG: DUF2946 family protein [Sphingomonas sp.]
MPRLGVLAVLALALLARLAIPVGWMPVTDADGWRLTICTGVGPLDAMPGMTMDDSGHKAPGNDHKSDTVCGFAAAGLAMAEPCMPPVLAALPIITAAVAPLRHVAVAVGRGLAAPPPPPTGPPLI